MTTYKDMIFCSGDGCANFKACFRALTPAIKKEAHKAGFLIGRFSDPKQLKCYKNKKGKRWKQFQPLTSCSVGWTQNRRKWSDQSMGMLQSACWCSTRFIQGKECRPCNASNASVCIVAGSIRRPSRIVPIPGARCMMSGHTRKNKWKKRLNHWHFLR